MYPNFSLLYVCQLGSYSILRKVVYGPSDHLFVANFPDYTLPYTAITSEWSIATLSQVATSFDSIAWRSWARHQGLLALS